MVGRRSFPIGKVTFQGQAVKLGGGMFLDRNVFPKRIVSGLTSAGSSATWAGLRLDMAQRRFIVFLKDSDEVRSSVSLNPVSGPCTTEKMVKKT